MGQPFANVVGGSATMVVAHRLLMAVSSKELGAAGWHGGCNGCDVDLRVRNLSFPLSVVAALTGGSLLIGCQGTDLSEVAPPPGTTNQFIEQVSSYRVPKIDLLFVVDSSPGMEVKQELLALSAGKMVRHLIFPSCVDANGNPVGDLVDCPEDSALQYDELPDVNVAVITASLGTPGASLCTDKNDRAHLIGSLRAQAPRTDESGVLKWRYGERSEAAAFVHQVETQIRAVGTQGCERQAPLEAWYRFLVEPEPPLETVVGEDGAAAPLRDEDGAIVVDETLLFQREEFLRPESLLMITVLSDEDDCSSMAGGELYESAAIGYLMHEEHRIFPRPTPICATNPNDECCFSCINPGVAPEHCDRSVCEEPSGIPADDDAFSLRCHDQRRRFGVEMLYPVSRYVDALTRPTISDTYSGDFVDNPLLRGAGKNAGHRRDPGLVFYSVIGGVPWQDVATEDSMDPGSQVHKLLTASELNAKSVMVDGEAVARWSVILGEPGVPARSPECQGDTPDPLCGRRDEAPLDPFMRNQVHPRAVGTTNPVSGDAIVGSDSTSPTSNNINGHEHNPTVLDRLQNACIHPLEVPIDCSSDEDCLCHRWVDNSPVCQPPQGGAATTTQYWQQAKPTPRLLQVARDFGANSVVSSACPKVATGDPLALGYGLNPASLAIAGRLNPGVSPKCLSRDLALDDKGLVNCKIVEAGAPNDDSPFLSPSSKCEDFGRSEVSSAVREAIVGQLKATSRCGGESKISCETYKMCELPQLEGKARDRCVNEVDDDDSHPSPGFCYFDADELDEDGNPLAGERSHPTLRGCPGTEEQSFRFVGGAPYPNTIGFLLCEDSETDVLSIKSRSD